MVLNTDISIRRAFLIIYLIFLNIIYIVSKLLRPFAKMPA